MTERGLPKGTLRRGLMCLLDRHRAHRDMYIPEQIGWRWEGSSPSVCRLLGWGPRRYLRRRSPGTLAGFLECHLFVQQSVSPAAVGSISSMKYCRGASHEPKINRFFSGRRFPFATPSSSDDQIFFFEPSLLVGRLLAPGALDPRVGLEDIVCSSPTMRQGGGIYLFPKHRQRRGNIEQRRRKATRRYQNQVAAVEGCVGERSVVQARAARSGESGESGTEVGEESFALTKPRAQGTRRPIQST
jgi:hypothetical protein